MADLDGRILSGLETGDFEFFEGIGHVNNRMVEGMAFDSFSWKDDASSGGNSVEIRPVPKLIRSLP